jgi:hypothetical protein
MFTGVASHRLGAFAALKPHLAVLVLFVPLSKCDTDPRPV